jgi:hypothetical protein
MIYVRARRGCKLRAATWGIKQTRRLRKPFRPAWMKHRRHDWALSPKACLEPMADVFAALQATLERLSTLSTGDGSTQEPLDRE